MHHWQTSGQMSRGQMGQQIWRGQMGQQGMGQETNQLCNTIGLFDSQIQQWNRIMSQQSQSSPKSLEARAQLGALMTWRNSLQQSLHRLQQGGPSGMMAAASVKESCAKALTAVQRSAAYLAQEYGIQPAQQLIQATAPGFALKARQTRAPEFRVGTARRMAPIGTTRTLAGMRVPDFRPIPMHQIASRRSSSRGASQQFRQPWQSQVGKSWQSNQPRSQQMGTTSSSMAAMGQFGPASSSKGAQYGQMGFNQYGSYGSQYGMGRSSYGSRMGKRNY